jgi:hypothetical protein
VRRVFGKRAYLEPHRRIPPSSAFACVLDALCETFGEVEEWEGGDVDLDIRDLIGCLRVVKLGKEGGLETLEDDLVEEMIEEFIKQRGVWC